MARRMRSYSQNGEDLIALRYFKGLKGALLEVGANEGVTLSNSRLLIDMGWSAVLLEPSYAVFPALSLLHRDNPNVMTLNYGIAEKEGFFKFYESGAHVPGGSDVSLVSTAVYEETLRWRKQGVQFTETEVHLTTFKKMMQHTGKSTFDLISMDAESYDWIILQQIDLNEVGCQMLIIEWNSDPDLSNKFTTYCNKFGMKEIHRNAENILFAR